MIHVVNGPNLNMLGQRETGIYGSKTLAEVNAELEQIAVAHGSKICFFQSNHEGEIIDYLQGLAKNDKIILNPGGLGHTSVSLRDCIAAIEAEVFEVHISNIYSRESFRRRSMLSPVCLGIICGFGTDVYKMALNWLLEK